MRDYLPRMTAITLGLSLIIIGGCAQTQPSRFYLLTSLPNPETGQQAKSSEPGVAIAIGPVQLPKHLDRPQIVTRATPNMPQLADFDRWAEPLEDNFAGILAENLSILMSTDRVTLLPRPRPTPVDYRVEVEVTRFDRNASGDVTLVARWALLGKIGRKLLVMKKSSFREPIKGKSHEATVAAMSRALGNLSRDIAEAMKAHPPK